MEGTHPGHSRPLIHPDKAIAMQGFQTPFNDVKSIILVTNKRPVTKKTEKKSDGQPATAQTYF